MRLRLGLLALALPAALVPATAASAADVTIQAVDGTAANDYRNGWAPQSVSVQAGDTVTWRFDGTQVAHNVASDSSNWSLASAPAPSRAPVSFRFTTPGTYQFICNVHPTTMRGTVVVGAAGEPPPPPPPPEDTGPEPYPNPSTAPEDFESVREDHRRPRLRRLRIRGARHGMRVRFRVSERARVKVRVKKRGITLETKRVRASKRRRRTVRIRGFRPGRYRVVVRAVDRAGNRSRRRAERVHCY